MGGSSNDNLNPDSASNIKTSQPAGKTGDTDMKKNSGGRVATIISIIIAIVGSGGLVTGVYNCQQAKIRKIEALRHSVPKLLSDDPKTVKMEAIVIKELTNKELAARLVVAGLMPDRRDLAIEILTSFGIEDVKLLMKEKDNPVEVRQVATRAFDNISATRGTVIDVSQTIAKPPSTEAAGDVRQGWAYLGTYSKEDRIWQTRYMDFARDADPSTFIDEKLSVREVTGALNVRRGMPDPQAVFAEVIDVLKPGSEVTIHDVQPWQSSGFMWARISYEVVSKNK